MLNGLMQNVPLMISSLLRYAGTYHGETEIVTRMPEGAIHRYSYGNALARAARLANALRRHAIVPGDRIGSLAWNTYRHFEMFYGVSGSGAVLHTVNPRLFEDQIAYIINHAGDRLLFVDPGFVPLVEKLQPRLGMVEAYVVMTSRELMPQTTLDNVFCYEDLLAQEVSEFDWPEFSEEAASSLCYTSGTTGDPKGVLYSHRSTILHALGAAQTGVFNLGCEDCILPIAPMYHANAWAMPYIAALVGAKLVLPGAKMDPASLHELIEAEGVTFTCAVPTVWTTMLEHLRSTGAKFTTLQRATIGGSAVPRAMVEAYKDGYGIEVLQLWGMTEVSPLGVVATPTRAVNVLAPAARSDVLSKQGRVVYGLDIKIADGQGNAVPRDGVAFGDLLVRGPWAARAYFRRENEATLDADGWFATGDVATWDRHGYVGITDRTKDVIKSGGEWISSIALENAAAGHPGVGQVAVIGVHHPKWEERPLMLVVRAGDTSITRDDILGFLKGKIADWWLPDDVHFLGELPLTATGKIKKTALREAYKDFSFGAAQQHSSTV